MKRSDGDSFGHYLQHIVLTLKNRHERFKDFMCRQNAPSDINYIYVMWYNNYTANQVIEAALENCSLENILESKGEHNG